MKDLNEHLDHIAQETDRRQLGLWLYAAETTIGIGRRAVRELRTEEPMDEVAIAEHQADIVWGRLARNALRRQLKTVKGSEYYGPQAWLKY